MCGIAGLWNRSSIDEERTVSAMTRRLRRRGPDSVGFFHSEPHRLAFGHARLSILDTSTAADQPFLSQSGRTLLIFNGEIYNHKELRARLGVSYRWRTLCDTETVVELIDRFGVADTLPRLVGMFAFAVFDFETRTLCLARDRFGEKPLFYCVKDGSVAFASQTSALLEIESVGALNEHALSAFVRRGWVPPDMSIYRDVHPVPPGSSVSWRAGESTPAVSLWAVEVKLRVDDVVPTENWHHATALVERALQGAVRRQVQADVPVGCFLSGGIDSSLIAALMSEVVGPGVRTFSVEAEAAAGYRPIAPMAVNVAKQLGTKHSRFIMTARDAFATLLQLPEVFDEPHGDASALPMVALAKFARADVTVALSGDGADELFGGYNRLRAARLRDMLGKVIDPAGFRPVFGGAATGASMLRVGDHARRIGRLLSAPTCESAYVEASSPFASVARRESARGSAKTGAAQCVETFARNDLSSYLPGNILVKLDRCAMFSSLETRCPFLDPDVVLAAETAGGAPSLRTRRTKAVLRQVLSRRLSPHLFDGPKLGFSLPLRSWLREAAFRELVCDTLSSAAAQGVAREHFAPSAMDRFLNVDSPELDERAVFALLSLTGWLAARAAGR